MESPHKVMGFLGVHGLKGPWPAAGQAPSLRSSGMYLGHRLLPTRLTSPLPPSSRSLNAARLDRDMLFTRASFWRRSRRTYPKKGRGKTSRVRRMHGPIPRQDGLS
ncbi:hypothetical protein CGC21_27605 [Leishmania donovani]|uniref:Uncharacterized protein n=1 Tax=Leishmania donovani TaxID=5661 RepID=A0A504XVJ2_LEIDO|nr:hypothetical protein CGC21_27605 [Leishmania donovani]